MDPERRRILVPKRSFMQKNPRLFNGIVITAGLLIFFSRPIYDAFIRDDLKQTSGKAKPF